MSSPSVPAVTCEGSRRPRRLIAFIERSSIYADWDWRIETSCQNGLHSVHTRSGHAEAPLACMQLAEEAAAREASNKPTDSAYISALILIIVAFASAIVTALCIKGLDWK